MSTPTRIYISGPMTGLPDNNAPAFDCVAKVLRGDGYEVVNPSEMDAGIEIGSHPWEWYLTRDLKAMLDCNTVVLLPGWRKSRGASLELYVASQLQFRVFEFVAGTDGDDYTLHPTPYGNTRLAEWGR